MVYVKTRKCKAERPIIITLISFFGILVCIAMILISQSTTLAEQLEKESPLLKDILSQLLYLGIIGVILFLGLLRMTRWAFVIYPVLSIVGFSRIAMESQHGSYTVLLFPLIVAYIGWRDWYELS